MSGPSLSPFGERLRAWRRRRGLSQLDLALEAETTPRYVSFVETGRSRPGRDVVMRIAEALALSLRDRNALLIAAGLTPVYTEHAIDDDALAPIRSIIERVLANHDPYPAFAFAPGLRLLQANASAERLFPGMVRLTPEQLVTIWCTPQPEQSPRESRDNAHRAVSTLRHELTHHPHPSLPALLATAEKLARAQGAAPVRADDHDEVVMSGKLVVDGTEAKTVSTVMRFDHATDVTVAELRVELIFPADDASDALFRRAAQGVAPR